MAGIRGVAFGELLWDIIAGKAHIGGAPFNLAAHMARLGASFSLLSAVGEDDLGRAAMQECRRFGIDTSFLSVVKGLPTGTVQVELDAAGKPEYTINEPVAWDRIGQDIDTGQLSRIGRPDLLVFGTLAQRSGENRKMLARLIEILEPGECFFDVNLRLHYHSAEMIRNSMKTTTILKLNDEEVPVVSRYLWKETLTDANFFNTLVDSFPLHTLLITRGGDGSSLFYRREGKVVRYDQAVVDVTVQDTVGAGDSFSAAFLTAFLHGETREEALRFASRLSSYVASSSGAVPEYRGWIKEDTDRFSK